MCVFQERVRGADMSLACQPVRAGGPQKVWNPEYILNSGDITVRNLQSYHLYPLNPTKKKHENHQEVITYSGKFPWFGGDMQLGKELCYLFDKVFIP